jgi:hypothetical protein
MVFESQTKLISLIPQGQRGTSIFLTLNPGPQVVAADGILTRKRRWMRRYMVVAADVEELPLDGNEETPFTPSVGCNLELTQVDTDGHPVSWWTLGFEAFGDIQSALDALAATYAFLQANGRFPPLSGERLSYPEWLDRL